MTAELAPSPAEVLRAEGLGLAYPSGPALVEASLVVGRGESVALVGPSGSGKSSLLACAAGIVRPSSGSVVFDEVRVDLLPEAARSVLRRERFGFVFQFGDLVPELSLVENAALPMLLGAARRRAAMAAAARLLEAVGLDASTAGRRPAEVSGGQMQRAAIARALVGEPSIVFADEPTGALDRRTGEEVLDLMFELTAGRGTSLVVATHDDVVARRCDRVVRVVDGRTDTSAPMPPQ